jgi:hypothetical protein
VKSFASTFALEDRKTSNTGVKLQISQSLMKRNSIKMKRGVNAQLHAFLISALDGSD